MEQQSIFSTENDANQPLAARLRPQTLEEFVGQRHLLGPGKVLRRLIESDNIPSMIFWDRPAWARPRWRASSPPHAGGVYRLFRRHQRHPRDPRGHAAGGGKPPLRRGGRSCSWTRSIASTRRSRTPFCRFVEKGSILLIGATTENPSFEINRRAAVAVQGVCAAGARRRRSRRAGAARACRPARLRRAKGGNSAGTAGGYRPFRQRRRPRGAVHAGDGGAQRRARRRYPARDGGDARAVHRRANRCCTTRRARSTTTSSPRCTSPCAIPIPTRRSTGWRGCWNPARTRCTSPAA